jgi:hypothetical protein
MIATGATMPIRVECYSGYRGEEEPRAFWLGERRIEVMELLDRWLSPEHRYFRVKGEDGDTYILRHDEMSGEWTLGAYTRTPRGTPDPEGPGALHSPTSDDPE